MAFRQANLAACVRFNSATSSEILDMYDGFVRDLVESEKSEPSSQTIAPSSFRCDRKNWFRLRGVQPDLIKNPDIELEFKAQLGTSIHRIIQTNLKEALGSDWLDIDEYLREHPIPYEYTTEKSNLETKIAILDPPIHFAVDGLIRWKDKTYLLEIKTADYSSFSNLTDPKPIHLDQIKCYATLLNVPNVLVWYVDRQHGNNKCYEMTIPLTDTTSVLEKIQYIQHMVECNLAPERLDKNDYMCNNCEYKTKCNDWG